MSDPLGSPKLRSSEPRKIDGYGRSTIGPGCSTPNATWPSIYGAGDAKENAPVVAGALRQWVKKDNTMQTEHHVMENSVSSETTERNTGCSDALLIEKGYEPVAVNGKAPKIKGWTTRPNTVEALAAERVAHPDHKSTGLRCGRLIGIDIDLHDPVHTEAVRQLAYGLLTVTLMERFGSKGGMLLYRTATPFPGKIRVVGNGGDTLLEILGQGFQLVAYGIHPSTDNPYSWVNDCMDAEPLTTPFQELVEVTHEQLYELAQRVAEALTERDYADVKVLGIAADGTEHKPAKELEADEYNDVLGAAHVIPNDHDWDEWNKVGMAMWNATAGDDIGREAFHVYSRKSDKYDADETDTRWEHYASSPADKIGAGSVFHWARQAQPDWRKPSAERDYGDPRKWDEYGDKPKERDPLAIIDPAKRTVRLKSAAGERAVKITWLMQGYIARGKFHILAGVAGTGKSTITFDLAATITRGGKWPDGSQAPVGDVLIWSGEDGFHDTILPRFLAAGGDPDRLYRVDVIMEHGEKRHFDPQTDVSSLVQAMRQRPNLLMVIIDPIVSFAGRDSHRNAETRQALQSVVDLAEERDVAVLGITHFTKGTEGRDPLERVTGSLAFGALARVVLAAAKSEDENGPRRLVRAKSNIGQMGGGFEYHLRDAPVPDHDFPAHRIIWSTRLSGSARGLLDELNPKEPSQRAKAIEFLEQTLNAAGNAGVAVKALRDAANGHGISWATVRRAKDEELAGKIVVKQNEGAQHGGWYWVWIGGAAQYGKTATIHPNNGVATVDRDAGMDDEIPY
jgi:putative DNA primase/helicase